MSASSWALIRFPFKPNSYKCLEMFDAKVGYVSSKEAFIVVPLHTRIFFSPSFMLILGVYSSFSW